MVRSGSETERTHGANATESQGARQCFGLGNPFTRLPGNVRAERGNSKAILRQKNVIRDADGEAKPAGGDSDLVPKDGQRIEFFSRDARPPWFAGVGCEFHAASGWRLSRTGESVAGA